MREAQDIKAPDGYLLGGERVVRQDGTILFQRGWWQAPVEWAGEYVWVHCTKGGAGDLEVAPPGYSSFSRAAMDRKTVFCPRTKRTDGKCAFRRPERRAYSAKMRGLSGVGE